MKSETKLRCQMASQKAKVPKILNAMKSILVFYDPPVDVVGWKIHNWKEEIFYRETKWAQTSNNAVIRNCSSSSVCNGAEL